MTPAISSASGPSFSPYTPQYAAGMRTEPAVSVPMASGTMPSATADADPALDAKLAQLDELGFGNRPGRNRGLLHKFDGDVARVAEFLAARQEAALAAPEPARHHSPFPMDKPSEEGAQGVAMAEAGDGR